MRLSPRTTKSYVYFCGTFSDGINPACSRHKIDQEDVNKAVFAQISNHMRCCIDALRVLEKKVKSLSSKKMMLYSDYKDDKLTREEYVKRSKAMVEQIDELHQEIEQLKTEIPPEDNSSSKFETQLESIINMESFDREKIQKVIKKVIINGEDNIEIVWNTDDPFFK